MRLATVRHEGRNHAARVEDDHFDLLPQPDLGALLATPGGVDAVRLARCHSPGGEGCRGAPRPSFRGPQR